MEHNVDDLFEQSLLDAGLDPLERLALANEIPVYKAIFRAGYNARENQPRKQLAALLRAPQ